MGLEKADPATLKRRTQPVAHRYGFEGKASIRETPQAEPLIVFQKGLITTRITISAAATPGTSLSIRKALPDKARSPLASFLA